MNRITRRPVLVSRGISASARLEQLLIDATNDLMAGKTVVTMVRGKKELYTLDNVRQHLYGNVDDCEQHDKLLDQLMIATTDELPEIRSELQKIMARSAQEFVDSKAAEIFQSDAEERDAEYGDYLHEQMINLISLKPYVFGLNSE